MSLLGANRKRKQLYLLGAFVAFTLGFVILAQTIYATPTIYNPNAVLTIVTGTSNSSSSSTTSSSSSSSTTTPPPTCTTTLTITTLPYPPVTPGTCVIYNPPPNPALPSWWNWYAISVLWVMGSLFLIAYIKRF